ncbi:acetyl-CoA acetyltransferase cytosolic 1 [Prunus yedoensis var. nudiflora]|uniref:Acetyl-CoA acetyltransferase cytosolic 1 n=1 Tax=Prunus yedoensis var. nudiflora TaxID=2094558 RepID=A0A314YXR7_PRUYE|nr:acetyl-CoA acetyltransferase cytosolic 1 [Prunus yedoensis var. nudiflora]
MAPSSSDSIKPRDVCIVGVARTPMGGFLGSLSSFSATQLGSLAIRCALKRANLDPSLVQEVFFGNVLSANLGQAPARQAALGAGIPNSVICTTINKSLFFWHESAGNILSLLLSATMLAAQTIQLGLNHIVVAGGMESMSNAPKYLPAARQGSRLGHDTIVDGMLKDGLWDVYNDIGMGVCAEMCADQHSISREEQDSYAIRSFERGTSAQDTRLFAWEIVPVELPGGRGKPSSTVDKDDGLKTFDAAKLRKLRPSFKKNGGTVTAGNASLISDGAAALVLVSGEKALQLGLQVIAKIKGFSDAAQVVALANQKLLGLNPEKVNVHGGAVSLGHPLGCSGARILVTLLGVLRHKKGRYGVGAICNGGGGASALVLELMPITRVARSLL